jgi:hypothetical protein
VNTSVAQGHGRIVPKSCQSCQGDYHLFVWDIYETYGIFNPTRTRHDPFKPDINRTFERTTNGHKGEGNGSQTAQRSHANGPDMGQRGNNHAMNTPNAPLSGGIRPEYPQPIRSPVCGYVQLNLRQAVLRPATKWGRAPTIGAPTRLTVHPPGLRPSAQAIVRSVTGQLQLAEAERVASDAKKVPTASATLHEVKHD